MGSRLKEKIKKVGEKVGLKTHDKGKTIPSHCAMPQVSRVSPCKVDIADDFTIDEIDFKNKETARFWQGFNPTVNRPDSTSMNYATSNSRSTGGRHSHKPSLNRRGQMLPKPRRYDRIEELPDRIFDLSPSCEADVSASICSDLSNNNNIHSGDAADTFHYLNSRFGQSPCSASTEEEENSSSGWEEMNKLKRAVESAPAACASHLHVIDSTQTSLNHAAMQNPGSAKIIDLTEDLDAFAQSSQEEATSQQCYRVPIKKYATPSQHSIESHPILKLMNVPHSDTESTASDMTHCSAMTSFSSQEGEGLNNSRERDSISTFNMQPRPSLKLRPPLIMAVRMKQEINPCCQDNELSID